MINHIGGYYMLIGGENNHQRFITAVNKHSDRQTSIDITFQAV